MKKNYSFPLSLLCIPLFAVLFLSYTGGQNVFYVSGSPSDIAENAADVDMDHPAGYPGDCTRCHNNFAPELNSSQVMLTVPSDYELNMTYSLTIASTHPSAKQGFQMSVEDDSGNKVGDFTDDGTNNQDFDLGRGEAITHTFQGTTQTSWTFDWTAPATDVGDVTFYAVVNATNGDFDPEVGDLVMLKQSESNLLSVDTSVFENLKVYPNPSHDIVTIDLPSQLENDTNIQVYDFLGKQVQTQTINSVNNTLNVSEWQSGVYLMQITHEDASIVKRFVKL